MAGARRLPRGENQTESAAMRFAEKVAEEMTAAGFTDVRNEVLPLKPVPAICVLGRRSESLR